MYRYLVFIFAVFLLGTGSTEAYNSSINEPALPYEIFSIETDIEEQSEYLGELKGDPHMYEFTLDEGSTLSLELRQAKDSSIPFNIIVIKENTDKKGVAEVGRLKGANLEWKEFSDSVLGIKLNQGEVFEKEIDKGVYRVEVSTPDNFGKYMLVMGSESSDGGYFRGLASINRIQNFFEAPFFAIFKSSYVYYPIGIILLSILIYFTWRNRHKIKNKNA